MAKHNKLGTIGESQAVDNLIVKGYNVFEKNWRYGRSEVDIIAFKDDLLVFIEVKTRSTTYFGEPHLCVSDAQQRRIIDIAEAYLEEKNLNYEVRFDIIGIALDGSYEHIEGAFESIVE